MCMPSLTLIFTTSVRTLQPTRPLGQVWSSTDIKWRPISKDQFEMDFSYCPTFIKEIQRFNPNKTRKAANCTHQDHDEVIKWNPFPCYRPFVRGIPRWPVDSPHKGQWRRTLVLSLICTWFETPSLSLWRHCNGGHYFGALSRSLYWPKSPRIFRFQHQARRNCGQRLYKQYTIYQHCMNA